MKGKRIIVSGAASGIGSSIFVQLLRVGAYPIGIDIQPIGFSELEDTLREHDLSDRSNQYAFSQCDAADKVETAKIIKNLGSFDGLVNNAGLLGNDVAHGGRSVESFHKMMHAHTQTALVLTELCYPLMKHGSAIVNIGSIETIMAAPDVVLYAAAKGALHAMTIAYATTLAPKGIRVNMVTPGNVNTERNKAQYTDDKSKLILQRFEKRTPLGRSAEPKEIANAVLFLLSEKSSAITGQELVADCGYTRALWDPEWTEK